MFPQIIAIAIATLATVAQAQKNVFAHFVVSPLPPDTYATILKTRYRSETPMETMISPTGQTTSSPLKQLTLTALHST